VYPAKDASDHKDGCPDNVVACVCGERLQRKALSEHMMEDAASHLAALVSVQERGDANAEKALDQERKRRNGEWDDDCKRRKLDMEDDGKFEWEFDLSMFEKQGTERLFSETFCERGFLFRLMLLLDDQTDDEWLMRVVLTCTGKNFETTRMLVGVRATFRLEAAGRERFFPMTDNILINRGSGYQVRGVAKDETSRMLGQDRRLEGGVPADGEGGAVRGERGGGDHGPGVGGHGGGGALNGAVITEVRTAAAHI
jgi:hypothetical protein